MPIPPKVIARRRLIDHFFAADAVRPEEAISFEPSSFREHRALEQLEHHGVLHAIADGRYYLDVPAYQEFRSDIRQRAGIMIAVGVVIGAALGLLA